MFKTVVSICIFVLACNLALGQEIDTASHVDSVSTRVLERWNVDSLKIISWGDSVRENLQSRFNLDSLNLKNKVDSLGGLGFPHERYSAKLDSVIRRKDEVLHRITEKQKGLLARTRERLNKWENLAREKVPDRLSGIQTPGANDLPGIPTEELPKLPKVDVPDFPELGNSDFTLPSNDFKVPELDPKLKVPDELGEIQSQVGEVSEKISALEGIPSDPDKAIEQSVQSVSQLDGVKEELASAEGIRDNEFLEAAESMKDPEALKEEVKQQVVKKAVNHFAGKEQVLQQAMEKMSKYKQKYESLNSLSELKKRPPNPMKEKPLRERLVPGVVFQILRNEKILLDINPNVGYRLTGRITSGAGWNQRIGYSTIKNYFTSASIIYGPRLFTEYKVWRGFSGRIEFEYMNAFVPPRLKPAISADDGNRQWIFTTMVGIKKEYRFMKSVKGTMFMMFNVYDPKHRSPYGDVVNSRFGFEWRLVKKR